MVLTELDLPALRRWVVAARADLAAHADALDRLNVFPVPDGDTGTNMQITVQQALRSLAAQEPTDLTSAAALLGRAMLTSARGNSGVILSQLVRGVAATVEADAGRPLDGAGLARALRAASDLAWAGVARPVEGTILSVARAAAEGAESASGGSLVQVAEAATDAAGRAVEATTEQLPALREAGVVDAGGAGYLLVLEALLRVVRGRAGLAALDRLAAWLPATDDAPRRAVGPGEPSAHASADGPAYEVMYLLEDSSPEQVDVLRAGLDRLGDSLVVAGGPELWSVHVHTDDVAGALEAGASAGRPHQFSVTRFADDAARGDGPSAGAEPRLIALVSGPGLADLVGRRGGEAVPNVGRIAASRLVAMLETGTAVVLCEDQLARDLADEVATGRPEVVVAGSHPTHLVAALDVLDLDAGAAQIRAQLADLEREMRTFDLALDLGAVPMTTGAIGDALAAGELATVVTGAGVDAEPLVSALRTSHPDVEVVVIDGGGARPSYALGVE